MPRMHIYDGLLRLSQDVARGVTAARGFDTSTTSMKL